SPIYHHFPLSCHPSSLSLLFIHQPPTAHTYTPSLHDALPILRRPARPAGRRRPPPTRVGHPGSSPSPADRPARRRGSARTPPARDRKSTRLNSVTFRTRMPPFC